MTLTAAEMAVPPYDGTGPVFVTSDTGVPESHKAPSAAADGAGTSDPAVDGEFDPSAHTVAEVQDYLAANPDQTDTVLARERAGKARTTLIGD